MRSSAFSGIIVSIFDFFFLTLQYKYVKVTNSIPRPTKSKRNVNTAAIGIFHALPFVGLPLSDPTVSGRQTFVEAKTNAANIRINIFSVKMLTF